MPSQNPAVLTRRSLLLRGAGLSASAIAAPWATGAAPNPGSAASSCILIYLLGGPSHIDSFDLKPHAPAEIRGPFQPIPTTIPGFQICEHLPQLAQRAGQYAVVRSVSHPISNHTPMIYYTLTGRETSNPLVDNDVRPPQPDDFPHLGSVIARVKGAPVDLPGAVAIPEVAVRSSTTGEFKRARPPLRGGGAGFLGPTFTPLAINGEPGTRAGIPSLALPDDVSSERLDARSSLLQQLEHPRFVDPQSSVYRDLRRQGLVLTGSNHGRGRALFALDDEPATVRDRYGRHRFGQALLLARRLTEAGVPLVAIHFNEMTVCDGWDTHSKNFEGLQTELLPMIDQGISALLDDLTQRGRLAETLVTCYGEFGRTPRINTNAGRDHWGPCSSAFFAGGGITGGRVIGASDATASYPRTEPVDPADLIATIYHQLGVSPETVLYDQLHRPHVLCTGRVLKELVS